MNATLFIKLYLITIPVFFAIDIVWLAVISKGFYREQLGYIMSESVKWPAALLFYLLYIGGLVLFAVMPAVEKQSLLRALVMGAALGLVAYATYDLTNYATIRDWPLVVVIVDLIWGTILSAGVSAIASLVALRWL
ncbi:MAG TPA: DUF2177 family protein [Spirochaetota bacterium]|nr:DUF2177 family protein [Spirochaetota bacterium]HPC40019.1 DUF2177 family protein [Spirochaetota bacterium]HPL15188.1 DUF2177 family protein [Spirochaetota bacterium]HQF09898.1 DUF2177 family protein [Spirochaetota bacterium]HQH98549.1 DUF2177 family protein [Spirochaetota bacterium]